MVDSGNFDWDAHADKFPGLTTPDASYHGLTYTKKFGRAAYITKATTHLMRDLGSMQTLHLRIRRVSESALKVATFLKNHPAVAWVRYPDLPDDPEHEKQLKYLPEGSCGVMCIGLKGGRAFDNRFMDALKLITIETHVADCYSCILHPASHLLFLHPAPGLAYAPATVGRTAPRRRHRPGPDARVRRPGRSGRHHRRPRPSP